MAKNREKFIPSEEQMALWPEVSGNEVNGLGEAKIRRPSPIYWQKPELTPFGPLMKWYRDNLPVDEELTQVREKAEKIITRKIGPKFPQRQENTAEKWTELVKKVGLNNNGDVIGITRMRPEWVIETFEVPYKTVIMAGVSMNFDNLKRAPGRYSAMEVARQYGRAHKVTNAMATWIHEQGWNAVSYGGSNEVPMLLIPPALECGLGELGKHGSIINRIYGSAFRLGAVVTDMPLITDKADEFGADEFCLICKACENACPPEAISPAKQLVRGVNKWYVDFDKCLPYFNESIGCGICLAVCPWSRPGVADKLIKKYAKRGAWLSKE